MRFRPTFCAHCGERIERLEWRIWTSRRFCAVCESEYKGQDLLVPAFMLLCLIVALIGIGSYIRSGPPADHRVSREPQRFVERQQPATQLSALRQPTVEVDPAVAPQNQIPPPPQTYTTSQNPVETNSPPNAPQAAAPPVIQRPIARVEQTVHYCGAETKKGTPCARRVKGPTRCYQHVGMPAMSLAAEPTAPVNKVKK